MAGSSLFTNLARAAKVVVLLLFFLPWVTVSCSPDAMQRMQAAEQGAEARPAQPVLGPTPAVVIARASGLDMAMGRLQMVNPAEGMMTTGSPPPGANSNPPELAPEIGVIAGAALLLLALLASFLKGSAGAAIGAGGSVLALAGFCWSVFVNYPPAVIAAFAASRHDSNANAEQIAQILSVQPDTVFYLVILLLVLAIVFNILAMRKPAVAAAPAEGTPPPAV
jgi:hypothetical protein